MGRGILCPFIPYNLDKAFILMATMYNSAKKGQRNSDKEERALPDADSLKQGRRQELEKDSRFAQMEEQKRELYARKAEEMIDNLSMETDHVVWE